MGLQVLPTGWCGQTKVLYTVGREAALSFEGLRASGFYKPVDPETVLHKLPAGRCSCIAN